MAEARRNLIRWLLFGVSCLLAPLTVFPQSRSIRSAPLRSVQIESPRTGSLSGRLTDEHSTPLAGIAIVLRNQATGTAVHARTAGNGAFRFESLSTGDYTLEAAIPSSSRGELAGIHISGGAESRLQAAIRLDPANPRSPESPSPAAPSLAERPSASPLHPSHTSIDALNPAEAPSIAANLLHPMPLPAAPVNPSAPSLAQPVSPPPANLRSRISLPTPQARPFIAPVERASLQPQSPVPQTLLALAVQKTLPLLPALPSDRLPIAVAAEQSDPSSSADGASLTAAQIQNLPASGRRWQDFLLDTPAATAGSSTVSFRDAQSSAATTIDGANTSLVFGSAAGSSSRSPDKEGSDADQPDSSHAGWNGKRSLAVSEAAIREVTAASGNVEAAAMRSSGGRAGIATESGSNSLHGQGFLFDRQNNWGARNPFTQWVQNTGTISAPIFTAAPFTPPDHEIVWGLGAGSRIRRDKLFWFAALDASHRNDPGLSMVKDPAQFFNLPQPTSPSIALLSAQLGETQNQAYKDYLGAASSSHAPAGLEQLAALLGPAPRTAANWTGFARIDWQATERQHFTIEGIGADSLSSGGGMSRVSATYGNHSFGSRDASNQWLLARWEAYFTPNLLAVTQASVGREIAKAPPTAPSTFEQSFLAGNFWARLPQIVVDSRYGFTIGNPSRFGEGSYPDERLYHAQQMLDWVHNRLLIKAGFELDHNADATSLLRNQTGTYHYANVASFISDALAFQDFGFADALDPRNPHNCGITNTRFGSQPCYSYYTQTMGPNNWSLSTNDWGSYVSAQWQPARLTVFSAGLRWEREQLPPAMAALDNPELPQTEKLPSLSNNWGPRASLAIGSAAGKWPVLRFGYGLYYGREPNATLETALTQTGSLRGDLSFFMRPADDCQFCSGGAPPFPYVFSGRPSSAVKPGAVAFAPNFRNAEIHQALVSIEKALPGRVELTGSAVLSLGRRLPIAIDTNFDPSANPGTITYSVKDPTGTGPIKAPQITVPFYASWPSSTSTHGAEGRLNPDYQQITEIMSRANSTYEAAIIRIARDSRRSVSLHAHYAYAHAMDWNPNETTLVAGSDVLDPASFSQEYGTGNLDVRHSAAVTAILSSPWKLRDLAGRVANGWMLSGIGQFHSGLPYTMRTSGSLPEEFTTSGAIIAALGPGMNGSGGDNRVYGVGRNTFRYPYTWKADLRLAKHFDLGEMRQLEIIAETFNLFNHQNVTQLETTGYSIENSGSAGTPPTLCFLTINTIGYAGCGSTTTTGATPVAAFGRPLNINASDFYRERQFQLGLRMRF